MPVEKLAGLNNVPWAQLQDAYGSAADVPNEIRALVAEDADARNAAFKALFSNICHQGTIYEASIHALPFLIEILRSDSCPDRNSLVLLVSCIVAGHGYWEIHKSILLNNPFTHRPVARPADLESKIAAERVLVDAVRKIGSDAAPLLIPELTNPEADVRKAVAEALCQYPGTQAILPALQSALRTERDAEVRDAIQIAINDLTGKPTAAGSDAV
jgi:HEAT repeats